MTLVRSNRWTGMWHVSIVPTIVIEVKYIISLQETTPGDLVVRHLLRELEVVGSIPGWVAPKAWELVLPFLMSGISGTVRTGGPGASILWLGGIEACVTTSIPVWQPKQHFLWYMHHKACTGTVNLYGHCGHPFRKYIHTHNSLRLGTHMQFFSCWQFCHNDSVTWQLCQPGTHRNLFNHRATELHVHAALINVLHWLQFATELLD